MAVEVVLNNDLLVKAKCRITRLIGDDDSSAIAALRQLSPYAIEKWSDFNHTHKTFNTKLYDLKVSAPIRQYFSKNFSICIKQNKGDEEKVKAALENLIPHAFGKHDNCPDWCKKDENNKHKYKYLKNGECLTDAALKEKLKKIITPFVKNAAHIAPCASSQANESFNYTVTTKHPKDKFYGGSESHVTRVALSVCQKNIGFHFICELYKTLEISPGKHTQEFRKKNRKKERERLKTKIPYLLRSGG